MYKNISFTLEEGQHCALIGSNGTGKTTLADIIRRPEEILFDGKLMMEKRLVLLQSANDEKRYDGTPLTNTGYSVVQEAGYFDLVEGHELDVFDLYLPNGSLTAIGEVNNTFILGENSLQVLDADNNDVASNYTFNTQEGVLRVTKRMITIQTKEQEWVYDGKEYDNYTDTIVKVALDADNDGLGTGDDIEVTAYPTVRDVMWVDNIYNGEVGKLLNEQTVVIKNQNGTGEDVSNNYVTFYDLYSHFVPGLAYVKKYPEKNREVSFYLQKEILKFDKFCEEQNLLCDNDVESYEDLVALKEKTMKEYNELINLRKEVRNAIKRADRSGDTQNANELREHNKDITAHLTTLRKHIKICDRVISRDTLVKDLMDELHDHAVWQERNLGPSTRTQTLTDYEQSR